MKLYVPEIGDSLVLTKDWTFDLHAEHRNVALGEINDHYLSSHGWIDESIHPKLEGFDYASLNYPKLDDPKFRKMFGGVDESAWREACRRIEWESTEYQKWLSRNTAWHQMCEAVGKASIEVTIPSGTRVKVDRIYIRKGKSDYSSITWYAEGLVGAGQTGKKKARSTRFWARLSDCNNVEFKQ